MNKPLRILLVDELALVRQGLKSLLHAAPGVRVVGEAADARQAAVKAARLSPDVIVTDLLPTEGGAFALLRGLAAGAAPVPVVILAGFSDEGFAAEAWRLGAAGYILKNGTLPELLRAVRGAAKGKRRFSVPVNEAAPSPVTPGEDRYHTLSLRERQVLHLSGLGKSSRFIANQLDISPRTVEAHRATIMKKMNLHGLGQLIRYVANRCKVPSVDYHVPPPALPARKLR